MSSSEVYDQDAAPLECQECYEPAEVRVSPLVGIGPVRWLCYRHLAAMTQRRPVLVERLDVSA